jgi:hypothetical protein
MNIHQAKMENHKELAIMQADQENIEAMMEDRKKAKTNPEKTKADLEEIGSAMMSSKAGQNGHHVIWRP